MALRADEYSQLPPTSGTKPEPNVIIQLCDSGNSNSGAPLTDPSNVEFAGLVKDWSKLTQRLWIWNYVTGTCCHRYTNSVADFGDVRADFGDYVQSYPNYYVIGPNIKFFADHGVAGVFEEGPGMIVGDGSDLEELKDYVMASMLWDPTLDPDTLIAEFLLACENTRMLDVGAMHCFLSKSCC